MPTLRVDTELGLVDRGESKVALQLAIMMHVAAGHRHAFRRAQEIPCVRRNDSLLASQQRDLAFALHRDDPVVHFAREQPERETDDAGGVTAHPLDREVRLPRVGRPEDGPDRSV